MVPPCEAIEAWPSIVEDAVGVLAKAAAQKLVIVDPEGTALL